MPSQTLGPTLLGMLLLSTSITNASPLDNIPLKSRSEPNPAEFLRWAKRAEPIIPLSFLFRRQIESTGAWSLRSLSCPSGSNECEWKPLTARSCCPEKLYCVSYAYKHACCPTKSRCEDVAASFPMCADPTWSLWKSEKDEYFCCLPGEKGYLASNGGGGCVPESMTLSKDQVATSAVPYGSGGGGGGSVQATAKPTTTIATQGGANKTGATIGTTSSAGDSGTGSSSSPNANSGSDSSSGGGSGGLKTPAIVGVAVGAVAGLVLLVLAVFLGIRWGKRKGEENARQRILKEQEQERQVVPPQPEITGSAPGTGYFAPTPSPGSKDVGYEYTPQAPPVQYQSDRSEIEGNPGYRAEMDTYQRR